MSMSCNFTVIIKKEGGWYVAMCAENDLASQGKTIEESIENLKEALELYYENSTEPPMLPQTFISTVEVSIKL